MAWIVTIDGSEKEWIVDRGIDGLGGGREGKHQSRERKFVILQPPALPLNGKGSQNISSGWLFAGRSDFENVEEWGMGRMEERDQIRM